MRLSGNADLRMPGWGQQIIDAVHAQFRKRLDPYSKGTVTGPGSQVVSRDRLNALGLWYWDPETMGNPLGFGANIDGACTTVPSGVDYPVMASLDTPVGTDSYGRPVDGGPLPGMNTHLRELREGNTQGAAYDPVASQSVGVPYVSNVPTGGGMGSLPAGTYPQSGQTDAPGQTDPVIKQPIILINAATQLPSPPDPGSVQWSGTAGDYPGQLGWLRPMSGAGPRLGFDSSAGHFVYDDGAGDYFYVDYDSMSGTFSSAGTPNSGTTQNGGTAGGQHALNPGGGTQVTGNATTYQPVNGPHFSTDPYVSGLVNGPSDVAPTPKETLTATAETGGNIRSGLAPSYMLVNVAQLADLSYVYSHGGTAVSVPLKTREGSVRLEFTAVPGDIVPKLHHRIIARTDHILGNGIYYDWGPIGLGSGTVTDDFSSEYLLVNSAPTIITPAAITVNASGGAPTGDDRADVHTTPSNTVTHDTTDSPGGGHGVVPEGDGSVSVDPPHPLQAPSILLVTPNWQTTNPDLALPTRIYENSPLWKWAWRYRFTDAADKSWEGPLSEAVVHAAPISTPYLASASIDVPDWPSGYVFHPTSHYYRDLLRTAADAGSDYRVIATHDDGLGGASA